MKKVVLMVVDAFAGRVLAPALQAGQLPHFQALAEAGKIRFNSVSIFPSITPAATSSIATGRYPRAHHIAGNYWYEPDNKTVIYYGADFWALLNRGFNQFFEDFVVKFNQERLQAETLFQKIEKIGLKTASLNYLIFHGTVPHKVTVPPMMEVLPGIPLSAEVYGPTIHSFGDLVQACIEAQDEPLSAPGGPLNRFGFQDDSTADLLCQLVEKNALPDFTLAYFPDNDFRSHEVGPEAAVDALENVDDRLGDLMEAFGGLDRMLDEICLIVTGDHAQSNVVEKEEEAGIRLDKVLKDFAIAEAGTAMETEDELVACPNLGAAQIYFHTPSREQLQRVIEEVLRDPRVDQAMWAADLLDESGRGYHVSSRDRGTLHFWPVGNEATAAAGDGRATDRYGCTWAWEGDLEAVDGQVDDQGTITFDSYPNAFERIAGLLDLHASGHLVLNAYSGYEFCLEHTIIHPGGGSHGALHRLDSMSPLLVAGAPPGIALPEQPRLVDVAPLCLAVLDLEAEYSIGASRVG